jgi:hypothetical protein
MRLVTSSPTKENPRRPGEKRVRKRNQTHQVNSSLEGNTRRAIDLHEGDQIDEKALEASIRAAVALNRSPKAKLELEAGLRVRSFCRKWRAVTDRRYSSPRGRRRSGVYGESYRKSLTHEAKVIFEEFRWDVERTARGDARPP